MNNWKWINYLLTQKKNNQQRVFILLQIFRYTVHTLFIVNITLGSITRNWSYKTILMALNLTVCFIHLHCSLIYFGVKFWQFARTGIWTRDHWATRPALYQPYHDRDKFSELLGTNPRPRLGRCLRKKYCLFHCFIWFSIFS